MQTQIHRGRLTSLAAVALLLLAAMAAGVVAESEESDAEAKEQAPLYMIPGFKNVFKISGTVQASGKVKLTYTFDTETEASKQLKLVSPRNGSFVQAVGGKFAQEFHLIFNDTSGLKDGDTAKMTVKVVDSTRTPQDLGFSFRVTVPHFTDPSTAVKDVRPGMADDIGLKMDVNGALTGANGVNFESKTYLILPDTSEMLVTMDGTKLNTPVGLPLGKGEYQLRYELTGPDPSTGKVTKKYTSEKFMLNVLEKPAFSVEENHIGIAGREFSLPLELSAGATAGTWKVTAPDGNVTDVASASSVFKIGKLAAEDAGQYSVKFVSSAGYESAVDNFTLKVYTVTSTVTEATGLVDNPAGNPFLEAGVDSKSTGLQLTNKDGFRMEVIGPDGSDATSCFTIDEEGYVDVTSGTQAGEYEFRFYGNGTANVTVFTAVLKYVQPPVIDKVVPVAAFTAE